MSWAIITGASSGIGLELARLFAADRWDLVLVARDETALTRLAEELTTARGIQCRVIAADLAQSTAPTEIFHQCADIEVSALVNNAGFGVHGLFQNSDLEPQQQMIEVNITSLTSLTHLFLQPMIRRRKGFILNVGSVAAFQPGPTMNVYYASKAFVYSFTYALARELEGTGVTATVLNPGTTRTNFFRRSGAPMKTFPLMDPAQVARAGYVAAIAGRRSVTPGLMNRVMACISPALPSALTSSVVRWLHRKRSAANRA